MAQVFKLSQGQPVRIFVEDGDRRALVVGHVTLVVCEPMNHQFVNTLVVEGGAVPAPRGAVPQPPPPDGRERFRR